MDRGTFIHDLIGYGTSDTLRLKRPIAALSATLRNPRTARCEQTLVVSDQPLQALCAALTASGYPDSAMQVRDAAGKPVAFIMSIRDAVRAIGQIAEKDDGFDG